MLFPDTPLARLGKDPAQDVAEIHASSPRHAITHLDCQPSVDRYGRHFRHAEFPEGRPDMVLDVRQVFLLRAGRQIVLGEHVLALVVIEEVAEFHLALDNHLSTVDFVHQLVLG
ncbi:MAG TPA: hypothetical protein VMG82_24615 [Candidatus Sulfotelmatobacter sp.]|nr:hypothetical protein [Candidatus Sulfotelmatobacter sp.]